MKIHVIDPLAFNAIRLGYNRPLDRHDFGGHIPDRIGRDVLAAGELRRFANITGLAGSTASAQSMYDTDTVQRHPLGSMGITKDGRIFRYSCAGATATVIGSLYQSAAPIANHLALTSAAQAIGDGQRVSGSVPIRVTPGNTAGAANLYAEGTLMVDTTPENGRTYRISGHAAIVASTAFDLFLDPDDRLQGAFTTATRYGLHHNPYADVIVSPTTATGLTVGGANCVIPANTTSRNYGWLQTRGPFACLINGTPGVGIGVVISATTAGAVDVAAVAAEINVRIIGRMMQVGVSGKNNAVWLSLD